MTIESLKISLKTAVALLVLSIGAFSCNQAPDVASSEEAIEDQVPYNSINREIDTLQREIADSVEIAIHEDNDKTSSPPIEDVNEDRTGKEYPAGHLSENSSSEHLQVETEKLLKTEKVALIRPGFIDERDSVLSVIEERMTLAPDTGKLYMIVEKWQSPVNYRGYKFNRKKVLLYGVRKDMPVYVYFYLGSYYLSFNDHLFYLDETITHVPFGKVDDNHLAGHLINYEDTI